MINLTEVAFSSSYYQGHADFLDCRIAEEAGLIHRGIHLVELRRSGLFLSDGATKQIHTPQNVHWKLQTQLVLHRLGQ